ncbi:pyruvate kinase [Facklamia miroungae]|uniref:Pyruvate kinase n=1 Tax=Facklamia miroungae TaxID=120956 RepID=A0A1G7PMK5_9LACT|nr:pyruvate kinase [Facklamia miroungae]NKZ28765.1 pyruvate kinase [Facklamia miroungae]SDF87511.1 pyruvate kinase [Facklamia miroungae]
MKKTKIVCTMGPSTLSKQVMMDLLKAGMNVARFNFSHGDHESQLNHFNLFKEAREETGLIAGMLLDTKGPEIRTHMMENNGVLLEKGHQIQVVMEEVLGNAERFSITYAGLIDDVKIGSYILIDDGLIELEVKAIDYQAKEITCEVVNSGVLKSQKGINVPGISLNIAGITDKDKEDIRFGCKNEVDFIAASFVRRQNDVMEIRAILEEEDATHIKIISKIENREGVDNIDEIIKVSDGIMVARGDLGVEVPTEDVPLIQKMIIKKCNRAGIPVVTATQMLDSMQRNPRPTRAEAGDVANAIFDGTDAVMLSGETAAGDYPLEAVEMMAKICERTESQLLGQDAFTLKKFDQADLTEAIGQAVGHTARNLGIQTIVAATSSGHTARMIAKYRPASNILAATFDEKAQRSLTLVWGVQPFVIGKPNSTDEMLDSASAMAVKQGFAKEGDLIIITAGVPVGEQGTTNIMKIQLIGTKLAEGQGVGNGNFIGKAVIAHTAEEANALVRPDTVLVTNQTDRDFGPALEKAGAIICESGGITSHAAIIGLERGIPVVVAVEDAMNAIKHNELITVDARRGIIYRGATVSI